MSDAGLDSQLRAFLAEDLGNGDLTTEALIPIAARAKGVLLAKSEGVLSGLDVARRVFELRDPTVQWNSDLCAGRRFRTGEVLAEVRGSCRALLSAERTALNLLQRMCGIATATARMVDRVRNTKAAILDTRKTAPGLRVFDKRAVADGGGTNHRLGLFDAILIKDNHIAALGPGPSPGTRAVESALEKVRAVAKPGMWVEVEVFDAAEAIRAVRAGADMILLDNLSIQELQQAVASIRQQVGAVVLEASGGVNEDSVRAIADTGVDRISVGALTHSVRACDISLEIESLPG